ncbi:MAG: hypothetical protein GX591_08510 [Planctomycetes bacterium]|nr:hypothetical protein [Planctomycetota bacterium]
MNRVFPAILAFLLAAATAATASCAPACPVETEAAAVSASASHCEGNMPQADPCPSGAPRDGHDAVCGCTLCSQGSEDARHAVHSLTDGTLHALAAPMAVAGLTADTPGATAFDEFFQPPPHQPLLSTVVLLI